MANKEIERKIAVIFATDVVGYSKAVEVNEEQTIKNFRACKKILDDLFKEHDGRILQCRISSNLCNGIPKTPKGKKRVREN